MNKDQAVELMFDTFQEINIKMAEQHGMTKDEIAKNLEQSSHSVRYMLAAVYDILLEKNIIKRD